jgi:lipopolysaccharide/colanic/teichoic acid biosynthesis glycosyltransferase
MLHNLIGTQGRREATLEFPRTPVVVRDRDRLVKSGSRKDHGFLYLVAYFASEYLWGHLVLALTFLTSAMTPDRARSWRTLLRALFKRVVDIIGASVGLLLTSPFFILLPILIKLDSPGPVFYLQLRIGYNRRRRERRAPHGSSLGRSSRDRRRQDLRGRPFNVIKFRTMVADAEKKCGPVWATKNDPRITRLGHFLRKTRLDEIPQFINVFLGQMSLVGPRPERPKFVEELSAQVENYNQRLQVKPGLTGLAQVENGYDSSLSSVVRKVHYDLQYIHNWSIWQDVKIMLKTVLVVVTGKGAF